MNRHFPVLNSLLVAALLAAIVPMSGHAQLPTSDTTKGPPLDSLFQTIPSFSVSGAETDVPYVATPQPVVKRMLTLANVSAEDVVYDLGSGDGRIPITAVQQFGARGVGIEINPERVALARRNAERAGVANRVTFREEDLFEADLRDATVVTLYLLPDVNRKLRPRLFEQLDPGDRVVSHDFDMGAWKPERVIEMGTDVIYLWVLPEEIPEHLLDE